MRAPIRLPVATQPLLVISIDCEEGFDWRYPVRGTEFDLTSIAQLPRVADRLRRHGARLTCVATYPVVDDDATWAVLEGMAARGDAVLGAHLHPWVTPPYDEAPTRFNSYQGNLEPKLEAAKVARIAGRIADRTGGRPTLFKAGRYGFGPSTAAALAEAGFEIDLSFMPFWDYEDEGGPSFVDIGSDPVWLEMADGAGPALLELPHTAGFVGLGRRWGAQAFPRMDTKALRQLKVPSAFAWAGLLNRIRLSPEGVTLGEAKRLTERLLEDGQRVFHLSFHSTSLVPGLTPYAQTEAEVEQLLGWLDAYVDHFTGRLGGQVVTPHEVRAVLEGGIPDISTGPAARVAHDPKPPINVMLCCNEGFMQHVAVALVSLLANNPGRAFDIVVVSGDPLVESWPKLQRTLAPWRDSTVRLVRFQAPADLELPLNNRYTVEAYTRLWIEQLMPASVERVLYLDGDLIVRGDIGPLWDVELGGSLLAAVDIPGSTRCALIEIPEEEGYFNSGVMVVDLAQWRRTGALPELLDYIRRRPETLLDADQDALNACFHARRTRVDYVWNVISPFYFAYHPLGLSDAELERVQRDAQIVHFNGVSKPWTYMSRHPHQAEYYRYLAMTEWRDYVPSDKTLPNMVKKTLAQAVPEPVRRALRR